MIIGAFTIYDESDLLVFQIETLLYLCDSIVILGDNPTKEVEDILKSYERKGLVDLIINRKKDNFYERDERGDNERLFVRARELGADYCFLTRSDEIVAPKSLEKVKKIIQEYDGTYVAQFYRYDFWYNAHNYRNRSTDQHLKSKELYGNIPTMIYGYIFPISEDSTYHSEGKQPIPNFHCEVEPYPCEYLNHVLYEDIYILHYGYYRPDLAIKKGKFYNTHSDTTGNVWSHDMQIDDKEFIKEYGMGILNRK
jgi:hypothetical protein